jgi:hypothetical protein
MHRRAPYGRGWAYFDLAEALTMPGCPICRLSLRHVSRFLAAVSYEYVNDPGVRAELRAARGYCAGHAYQFLRDTHNGLGTAIIYRDIVGWVLTELNAALMMPRWQAHLDALIPGTWRLGARRLRTLADRLSPRTVCPACQTLAVASCRYARALVRHLADDPVRDRYRASDGLCIPHLTSTLPHVCVAADVALMMEVAARRLRNRGLDAETSAAFLVGSAGAVPIRTSLGMYSSGPNEAEPAAIAGIAEPGCPVCAAEVAAVDACLAALPARMLNCTDKAVNICTAAGLCNADGWRLLSLVPQSAACQVWHVARQAVGDVLRSIDAPPRRPRGKRLLSLVPGCNAGAEPAGERIARQLRPRDECPGCRARAVAAVAVVGPLIESMGSQPRGSAGQCLRHLVFSLRLAPDPEVKSKLIQAQICWYAALMSDLDEYTRKHDYRFRDEPWGAEANAPRRAIAWVAGDIGRISMGSRATRPWNAP